MGTTILIPLIGGLLMLLLMGLLLFVANLAKNVYVVKKGLEDRIEDEADKLRDFLDQEMAQRQKWILRELDNKIDAKGGVTEADLERMQAVLKAEIVELKESVRKLAALQQAMAAKEKQKPKSAPAKPKPKSDITDVFPKARSGGSGAA